MFWKKWKRDPNRGRAGRTEQANLERRTMGQLDADQDLRSTGRMGSGIEGLEYKELLSLNRFSILFKTHMIHLIDILSKFSKLSLFILNPCVFMDTKWYPLRRF